MSLSKSVFGDSQETASDFKEIDRGEKSSAWRCRRRFQMERRYINTFLKMSFFYAHVLRRFTFDRPKEERCHQRQFGHPLGRMKRSALSRPAEDGMTSITTCVDVMREAKATLRCRRTILNVVHSAARRGKGASADVESSQPDDFQSGGRSRRGGKATADFLGQPKSPSKDVPAIRAAWRRAPILMLKNTKSNPTNYAT